MKSKILNLTLILTSLIGYLEWGQDMSMFLFQGELDVISKLFTDPLSVLHPFTLLPLLGQILLLITLFQKNPSKVLTYVGMACIGVLLLMVCFVGLIGSNYKVALSALPFLITAVLVIRHWRGPKRDK